MYLRIKLFITITLVLILGNAFSQGVLVNAEAGHNSNPLNIKVGIEGTDGGISEDEFPGFSNLWTSASVVIKWPYDLLGGCATNIIESSIHNINSTPHPLLGWVRTSVPAAGDPDPMNMNQPSSCYVRILSAWSGDQLFEIAQGQKVDLFYFTLINNPAVNSSVIEFVSDANMDQSLPFDETNFIVLLYDNVFQGFGNIALPITLSEFKAAWNNGGWVDLKWTTVSEIGSDKFLVERSKDGRKWETIGNESARGAQDIRMDYFLKDYNPYAGINYYRLKMYDLDGSYKYSPIAAVMVEKEGLQAKLYPNPATDYAIIDLDAGLQLEEITLYNIQGKLIKHQTFSTASQYRIELANLAHGEYFLEMILSDKQIFTKKLILNGTGN